MEVITNILRFLTVVVIIAGYFLCIKPAADTVETHRQELVLKQKEEKALKEELAILERHLQRIRNREPNAVEQVAREHFGYCLPGERVYYFEDKEETNY